jgi:hypothetical protein
MALLAVAAATDAGQSLAATPITQPAYEREAQKSLPKSTSPLWAVLRHAQIGEDDRRGVFTVTFPPEVRALDRQTVTLSGFMLPLDLEERSRHFLLSKYTPVCPFCPPGQPNEVVEVTAGRGVELTDRMLMVTGRLSLTNNGEKGLFFRIDNAAIR